MEDEILIYYYVGSGRKTLTARFMRGETRLCDKSTGIKVDGPWDSVKRFGRDRKSEAKLMKFETEIRDRLTELHFHYKGDVPDDAVIRAIKMGEGQENTAALGVDLTLRGMIQVYRRKAETGQIFNTKTGKRVSKDYLESILNDCICYDKYLDSPHGINIDLGAYNEGTFGVHGRKKVVDEWDKFTASFKSFLANTYKEDSTISKRVYAMKTMLRRVCKQYGIPVESLLADLKWKRTDKKVVVLSGDQVEFVLKNFERMIAECQTQKERNTVQYWYVALVLNPRRRDMDKWDKDNLYVNESGRTWIRYYPEKTKNSSAVMVEAPLPPTLLAIFEENLTKHKKLLPPLPGGINAVMKRIAKRYEIFHNDIQVMKEGEFKTVKMYQYVHIHMMRGSGMTHKLENDWSETDVKELSGHTYDSESFRRYVKISQERKKKVAERYFQQFAL